MKKDFKVGDVFLWNGSKYVLISRRFEEWYNTGGMGEYHYNIIELEKLNAIGDVVDSTEIENMIIKATSKTLNEYNGIEILDEAPFDLSSRNITLYSARRKKPKNVVVYE